MNDGPIVAWERVRGGSRVHILRAQPPRVRGYGYVARHVALSKMYDVDRVSADFSGAPRVFDARLRLLLDSRWTARCFCIYECEVGEGEPPAPSLAVRIGDWTEETDCAAFEQEADKSEYLLHGAQVAVDTIFLDAAGASRVCSAVAPVERALLAGVEVRNAQRVDHQWHRVHVAMCSAVSTSIEFGCHARECRELEAAIDAAVCLLDGALPVCGHVVPDGDVRMSYAPGARAG